MCELETDYYKHKKISTVGQELCEILRTLCGRKKMALLDKDTWNY